jgi:hypothetical protein
MTTQIRRACRKLAIQGTRLNVKNKTYYFGRSGAAIASSRDSFEILQSGQCIFSLSHSFLTFICHPVFSLAREERKKKQKNKGRMEYERAEESAATIARHSSLAIHSRTRDSRLVFSFRPCISEITDPDALSKVNRWVALLSTLLVASIASIVRPVCVSCEVGCC